MLMMYDFLLIIAFFIAFKMYDIYIATAVLIVGGVLQVFITRIVKKRFDKKQLVLLAVIMVFGGMTLYFHNPIFIKWKPTIVFWILGFSLFISQYFGKKPLIQHLMGHAFEGKQSLPAAIWKKLNFAWTAFFLLLGIVNIFVAYNFSTDAWVNFKLYGVLAAVVVFGIAQSVYLSRYISMEK